MRSTAISELLARERFQYLLVTALSIVAVAMIGVIYQFNSNIFQKFSGSVNPLAAAIFIVAVGIICSSILLSKGWFAIYKKGSLKFMASPYSLAVLLGMIMILVDIAVVLPADINILFPVSLIFYPAMGFLAEIMFHVLPLTVLVVTLSSIFRKTSYTKIIRISILLVALIEPVYQTVMGFSSPQSFWTLAYVALNVFLINLCELFIYKRHDFVSMYAFRLVYYLIWHIGWGYIRLPLLF